MRLIQPLFILCLFFPMDGFCQNTLTQAQKEAGWKLLFDGHSFEHFRGYKQDAMPSKGWVVEDGAMKVQARQGGGDILTKEKFTDFDLRLEFKMSQRSNSGIMYRVTEQEKAPWKTGPEYQLLDDMGCNLSIMDSHSTGGLYDLYQPPAHKVYKPAGDWHRARIVLNDNVVQHWLNGILLIEADLSSRDWEKRWKKSKFAPYAHFAKNQAGHIALQDHGQDVWFKNIRIRDLSRKNEEIPLFNGRNMAGWTWYTPYGGRISNVWKVKDKVMICRGYPYGYIQTENEYLNFILKLEWRWNPIKRKAGNSGVLLRKVGEDAVWPRCVEAQLYSGSAGDFWIMGKNSMKGDPERTSKRSEKMTNVKKTHGNENPIGEWNEYEIIADQGNITLIVNGEVVNRGQNADAVPGRICLQSEGVEIQFRKISLIPLD